MQNLITFRENSRRITNRCLRFVIQTIISLAAFSTFPQLKSVAQVGSREQIQKTTPAFRQKLEQWKTDTNSFFSIQAQSINDWKNCTDTYKEITVIRFYEPTNTFIIKTKPSVLKNLLLCKGVLFADDVKQPKEELLLGFVDYAVNGISLMQSNLPQYNGNGLNVSVKENRFDTSDIDFKGRILNAPFASNIVSGHASAMATIIAGGGNNWNYTKGAAWNASVSSASFQNLLPETPSYYQQTPVHVQNHSYGTVVEHFYGAEAAAYDASVTTLPHLVHIFSVGNSGTLTPAAGNYTGISGYANITGNFKQAKNIITVGHIDSFYNVLAPSSKGPAFDGRIKPELVAFGEDGSSGAAALVSGIALTLQQAYQQNYGALPPASLIKALLLNSADDVGAPGIDFASGYGNANGYKAMQTILNGRLLNGSVASNSTQTFNINVPAGIKQLKITLTWTDPAALPNNNKALIHDLDLLLEQNTGGQTWQPWVLSAFPNKDSIEKAAVRKRDTLNTVEQISINDPQPGSYTIRVSSGALRTVAQNFSIAWQLDSVETFQWYYPSKNDHLLLPDANVLRWRTSYTGTGQLQLSTDNGNNWQTISTNVDLSKGYFRYTPPRLFTRALLRMQTGAAVHTSDTFTFSQRPITTVGFNCADSVMINWQSLPGVTQYRVVKLGNFYLEPFRITSDTFLVFSKRNEASVHYAVEPLIASKPLVRSYTFDYNLQGAGCYIRTLLADLTLSNNALLQLQLSTTAGVRSVVFEKKKKNGFERINTTSINSTNLLYTFTDVQLNNGPNVYRAAVILNDSRTFFSDEAVLLFNGTEPAIVYPNPVTRSQLLNVLAKPEDELTIQLVNSYGMIMLEQKLNDIPEQINTHFLSKGIYYFRILNKQKERVKSGAVVVN
jgi:hypothetical protein